MNLTRHATSRVHIFRPSCCVWCVAVRVPAHIAGHSSASSINNRSFRTRGVSETSAGNHKTFSGKLYGYEENPRTRGILVVARANGLDLELIRTIPREGFPKEYSRLNKLARIPLFVGSDGFVLSEAIAIAVYVAQQAKNTTLLGQSQNDFASIIQWMSFFNSEVQGPLGRWWRMMMAIQACDASEVAVARKQANDAFAILEAHLEQSQYLVGKNVSLADYFAAGFLGRPFAYLLDNVWRDHHPAVFQWYQAIAHSEAFTDAVGTLDMKGSISKSENH